MPFLSLADHLLLLTWRFNCRPYWQSRGAMGVLFCWPLPIFTLSRILLVVYFRKKNKIRLSGDFHRYIISEDKISAAEFAEQNLTWKNRKKMSAKSCKAICRKANKNHWTQPEADTRTLLVQFAWFTRIFLYYLRPGRPLGPPRGGAGPGYLSVSPSELPLVQGFLISTPGVPCCNSIFLSVYVLCESTLKQLDCCNGVLHLNGVASTCWCLFRVPKWAKNVHDSDAATSFIIYYFIWMPFWCPFAFV